MSNVLKYIFNNIQNIYQLHFVFYNLMDKMKIKYFSNSFKPRRKAFTKAANEMELDPENILVIGDEYLSDVLGGQRSCMWTAVIGEKNFRNQLKVAINQEEKKVENQNVEKDNVEIRY